MPVDQPGAEATYSRCAACHSERLVAQQGLDRDRWDKLLVWVVEEQGMPEIPASVGDTILDYLVQNYGPDRANFPRPRWTTGRGRALPASGAPPHWHCERQPGSARKRHR